MTSEPAPTLLIAEDEIMLRAIAVEMLREAGFSVIEAGDGAEALALLKANPQIGLLISDIKMPRMNGYELVEAALTLMPALQVLLLTGYAEEPPFDEQRRRRIRTLHKPFDLEQLCVIAQEIMDAAQ